MSREKRPLDAAKDGLPNEKRQRPALTSVIVEALKMDRLEKLCSSLEPLLRRVVGEEVERALAKLAPVAAKGGIAYKVSPKRIQGAESRNLRLQFRNKLALPLFTGSKVEGEQGSAIHVVLQDAATGQVVATGPEASAKLDIIVLEGDFSVDDEEDWTEEEFENYVVKEREGKRPLLTGDLTVTLKEGVGSLGELTFTDNSSWIRSRKFRLGVKVSGSCEGLRIREGKTDAFSVKDHRGELYKKHYPPALTDDVWRLDKIGKDGAFHKKLNRAGIFTVEDFLRLVVMDPQKLRNILGSGMSNRMWESTVEHAKTCVLSGKLYVYYADEKQNIGVIFNNIFQLMGLMAGGQYLSVDALSESEKVYVDKLVKVAYENWESVVEYDGEALIGSVPQSLKGIQTHTEDPADGRTSTPNVTSHHVSTSQVHSSSFAGQDYGALRPSGGSNGSDQDNYPYQRNDNNLRTSLVPSLQQQQEQQQQQQTSFGGNSSYLQHDQMLAATTSDWLQKQASRLEEMYSEEEIRAKSLELLESEDMNSQMQQLIRMFNSGTDGTSSGGGVAAGGGGGGFGSFFSSMEAFTGAGAGATGGLESPVSPAAAKGKVGWLKLKAALRWGIFIRKQAATRRAQIEELEDD